MGYILSYKRSGNHLVRALVEYLTHRPTTSIYHGSGGRDRLPIDLRSGNGGGLGVNPHLPAEYFKVHRFMHLHGRVDRSWPLIFVLRDPYECISSELRDTPRLVAWLTRRWAYEWARVLENARDYQEWPSRKIVLHYEDVVEGSPRAINELGQFLAVPPRGVESAISNMELIRRVGLGSLERKARSAGRTDWYRARASTGRTFRAGPNLLGLFERYASVVPDIIAPTC